MASSTPLTITISMPLKHHNASISSPLVVCGADATGTRESPTYQIVSCSLVQSIEQILLANTDVHELAGSISVVLVDTFVP
jgi:hypothetical protein